MPVLFFVSSVELMFGGVLRPRVLVVGGPTGVGKTRLSLALARRLPVEVISGDSAQVFTGLDIGTDKVSTQLRTQITHHLINVASCVGGTFTASDFFNSATLAIQVSFFSFHFSFLSLFDSQFAFFFCFFAGDCVSRPCASDCGRYRVLSQVVDAWETQ